MEQNQIKLIEFLKFVGCFFQLIRTFKYTNFYSAYHSISGKKQNFLPIIVIKENFYYKVPEQDRSTPLNKTYLKHNGPEIPGRCAD